MPNTIAVVKTKRGGVAVINTGPRFIEAEENKAIINDLAISFHKTWKRLKKSEFDHNGTHLSEKPKSVSTDTWKITKKLFEDRKKMSMLVKMHNASLNIATCTEDQVRDFLETYVTASPSLMKKTTIKNICSTLRGSFYSMGRQRHVSSHDDGVYLKRKLIMSTNNPVTTSLEETLITKVVNKAKDAGNDPDKSDKLCASTSPVGQYVLMLHFIRMAIEKFVRLQSGSLTAKEPFENLINHALQMLFSMHEGVRPKDLMNNLTHVELSLPLHDNVYALTLAFLHPETYRYLCENDIFKCHLQGLFKGKQKSTLLERAKSTIPCAYNALDIIHMYAICMKLRTIISPHMLLTDLVFKDIKSRTKFTKELVKLDIHGIAGYSSRYGMAKDDKKCCIDDAWTRAVMGHSDDSDTKEKYAQETEDVAKIQGQALLQGPDHFEKDDMFSDEVIEGRIALEFCPIVATGVTHNSKWLDEAFTTTAEGVKYRTDFDHTAKVVTRFLSGATPEERQEAYQQLITKLGNDHDRAGKWMRHIPFGTHIDLPDKLCPPAFRKVYENATALISKHFRPVSKPKFTPQLISFPQVVYGNWRPLINDMSGATSIVASRKKRRVSVTIDDVRTPTKKRKTQPVDQENRVDADASNFPGYDMRDVNIDNVIVILANKPDQFAMTVPKRDKKVWVAQVLAKGRTRDGRTPITGTFFCNKKFALKKKKNSILKVAKAKDKVFITEQDVVDIYEEDADITKVILTPENVATIRSHMPQNTN